MFYVERILEKMPRMEYAFIFIINLALKLTFVSIHGPSKGKRNASTDNCTLQDVKFSKHL